MPTNIDLQNYRTFTQKIQEYTQEMLQQSDNSHRRGELNMMLKELAYEKLILVEKIDKSASSQPI